MGSSYYCDRCKADVLLESDLHLVSMTNKTKKTSSMIDSELCVHCKEKVKVFIATPEMDSTVPGC